MKDEEAIRKDERERKILLEVSDVPMNYFK
jgi:hypothetical protein